MSLSSMDIQIKCGVDGKGSEGTAEIRGPENLILTCSIITRLGPHALLRWCLNGCGKNDGNDKDDGIELGMIGEIWDYRELFYFLAWRDVKVRYKQTLLGQ